MSEKVREGGCSYERDVLLFDGDKKTGVLSLEKTQINLVFSSLNRTFALKNR